MPWFANPKGRATGLVHLPDGQISHLAVQPLREKYSAFAVGQINSTTPAIPCPQDGRFAVVTDVGLGMRWTRMRA